jgi:hypothetical protein
VSFTLMTVKGQEYAMFPATGGTYQASYAAGRSAMGAARTSQRTADGVTVGGRTGTPSTSTVLLGTSPGALAPAGIVADRTREHRVTVEGLKPGRTYSYRVVSRDATGRIRTWPAAGKPPATFSTRSTDRAAPILRRVRAVPLLDGTAAVTWSTNEPTASTVRYGTSRARLLAHLSDGTATRSHRVVLTGLEPGRVYEVRVTAIDPAGNRTSARLVRVRAEGERAVDGGRPTRDETPVTEGGTTDGRRLFDAIFGARA